MDTMGNLQIQLTATDSKGAEKRGIFALTVTKNHEPALSAPLADAAGKAGEDFSYVLAADAFSDPDGDALSYSASLADGSALPYWMGFMRRSRSVRPCWWKRFTGLRRSRPWRSSR